MYHEIAFNLKESLKHLVNDCCVGMNDNSIQIMVDCDTIQKMRSDVTIAEQCLQSNIKQ